MYSSLPELFFVSFVFCLSPLCCIWHFCPPFVLCLLCPLVRLHLFCSVCPSVFVTRPTRRWTSWLCPLTSPLWLRTGLRRTTLTRAAASIEPRTTRKTAWRIHTPFSTSCCSWLLSTSWWLSPTGTGGFHAQYNGTFSAQTQNTRCGGSWELFPAGDLMSQDLCLTRCHELTVNSVC